MALVAGLGVLLVGSVAYAATRSSSTASPSCGQPWAAQSLGALGQPGHYRIDVAVPQALIAGSYPATQQAFQQTVQQMLSKIPSGITIEGIWLPAVPVSGATEGPYSYPANTPMPSDWPMPTDGMVHARLQVLWPYRSDILTGLINGSSVASDMQQMGIVVTVMSCPTGPVPVAQTIPISSQPVAPDSTGNVTANPGDVWFVSSSPAAAPATLAQAAAAFTTVGFTVLASWDATTTPNDWPSNDNGPRWRFILSNSSMNPITLTPTSDEKVFVVNTSSLPGV